MPHFEFGSHLLEHLLLRAGICQSTKVKDFNKDDVSKLSQSLNSASDFLKSEVKCGIIVQKVETIPSSEEGGQKEFASYIEFHPYFFQQYQDRSVVKFDDFKTACDQFFSQRTIFTLYIQGHIFGWMHILNHAKYRYIQNVK